MKVIYCAGEQGRVVLDILRRTGQTEDIVFLDDEQCSGTTVDGVPVIGGSERLEDLNLEANVIVAFGDKQGVRLDLLDQIKEAGLGLFNVIDPDATVSSSTCLGGGVTITAQSYIGPDTTLSEGVLVDSAVSISHDVHLQRGVTVAPNVTIAGSVTVGTDAYLGANATIIDDVYVGEKAVVGAGAVVTDDIPEGTTVVGVPARPIDE